MSIYKNIVEIHEKYGVIPPHPETYYQDVNNEHVFISHQCQPSEREENVRMARFLTEKTEAVKGKLTSSQHKHIVYVKFGEELFVFGDK